MYFFEKISDQFCRVVRTNLNIPLSFCETRNVWKFSNTSDTMIFFFTLTFGILRAVSKWKPIIVWWAVLSKGLSYI